MSVKLYVGNLEYTVTNEELSGIFAEAGEVVEATVIMDRNSGRSKGFGFVEMKDQEAAQKAMEMFNGKEVKGRTLKVNEARPKREE